MISYRFYIGTEESKYNGERTGCEWYTISCSRDTPYVFPPGKAVNNWSANETLPRKCTDCITHFSVSAIFFFNSFAAQ